MPTIAQILTVLGFAAASIAGTYGAASATCERAQFARTSDNGFSLAFFEGDTKGTGTADATFFTSTGSYTAEIPVNIALADGPNEFRSKVLAIVGPKDTPFLGASVVFRMDGGGEPCEQDSAMGAKPTPPDRLSDEFSHSAAEVGSKPIIPALSGIAPATRCDKPYVQTQVVDASRPEYPAAAIDQGLVGKATVDVPVAADDSVGNVTVHQSTGYETLDAAARRSAASSTYRAPIFQCKPVPGVYTFMVVFG